MVKVTLSLQKALNTRERTMKFIFPADGKYQVVDLPLEQKRLLTRLAEVNERSVAEQMCFIIDQAYAALPPCWTISQDPEKE